ncbi:MAG: LysR family transcriptional regulator [Armatimonadota bacterium]|nr:LysR family transcriptional regulator [Armatimonadota bacterium]MDR7438873.1 LysR family transcriptional regulator [Armatimonadota bacterium]MDR7562414.1 LysR family transcriptional regulator [Armatimonadota bacterium]MDR7601494.1 LysR family transcriptional regulator [Armatimonadota bacterium]
MLNVHQLKIFHTVARAGSFSRAAEALGITQPSVSIQVRDLERALGVELFEQIGKRTYLTEAGKILEEYASRILSLLEEAEQAVREVQGSSGGTLRVGAESTAGTYLLPPVLRELRSRFPEAFITLEIHEARRIQERILRNELDCGIVGPSLRHEALIYVPYRTDELVPVAAPDSAVARRGELTAKELVQERLILRERGSGTREVVEQAFRNLGLPISPVMELPSTEAVIRAAAANLGVGIVSRIAAEGAVRAGWVVVLEVPDFRPVRTLWAVRHGEKRLNALLRTFFDLLTGTQAPQVSEGDSTSEAAVS